MKLLQVEGLNKKYDDNEVLKNVSFSIEKGSTTSIIGPSASGKSTILKCLNLLEPIQEGRISFKGKLVSNGLVKAEDVRKKIGIVFQEFNLWPNMTVLKNLILAPILTKKLRKEEAKKKAVKVLKQVNLEGLEKRLPGTLSGGQRQRVAIARALMMDYEVLLLDEITSALDPESSREVLEVLKKLKNVTLIFVTHHIEFARKISNNVIMIDEGRIIEQGDVINNPKKKRTKQFLKHLYEVR